MAAAVTTIFIDKTETIENIFRRFKHTTVTTETARN